MSPALWSITFISRSSLSLHSITPTFLAHLVFSISLLMWQEPADCHLSQSPWFLSESNIKESNFGLDMLDALWQSRSFWSNCRLYVLVSVWVVFILSCSERRLPWKGELSCCVGDFGWLGWYFYWRCSLWWSRSWNWRVWKWFVLQIKPKGTLGKNFQDVHRPWQSVFCLYHHLNVLLLHKGTYLRMKIPTQV